MRHRNLHKHLPNKQFLEHQRSHSGALEKNKIEKQLDPRMKDRSWKKHEFWIELLLSIDTSLSHTECVCVCVLFMLKKDTYIQS